MRKRAMSRMTLCFAPAVNTRGRKDATGAFIPEARRFLAHHSQDPSTLVLVDNQLSAKWMRGQVLAEIAKYKHQHIDGVFFFCHGYRRGIQFGFTTANLRELATAIAEATGTYGVVCFYSCDVARDGDRKRDDDLETLGGDGGFADEMRDALCRAGATYCTVDGHTTPGHTTRNPHVRRFEGCGSEVGGRGGYYIVPRTKKDLFAKWRKALRGDLRFEYPLMNTEFIIESL